MTDKDLKGKKFNEYKEYNDNWRDDICGHGAIRFFYPELESEGANLECNDFKSLCDFPAKIVKAIKEMRMTKVTTTGICKILDMLTAKGQINYRTIERSLYVANAKALKEANISYRKAIAPFETALALTIKHIEAPPDSAEAHNIYRDSLDRYNTDIEPFSKILEKEISEADNLYDEQIFKAFWDLFKDPKNRISAWR